MTARCLILPRIFFLDFGCKRMNWFHFKCSRDFCGFMALSWRLWEFSRIFDEVWKVFRPIPAHAIGIFGVRQVFDNKRHVVNFPRKWPTFPITDCRVLQMLRELINNVNPSRKHFYIHLSPQPPWHIAICLTKAEFSKFIRVKLCLISFCLTTKYFTHDEMYFLWNFLRKMSKKRWKIFWSSGKSRN